MTAPVHEMLCCTAALLDQGRAVDRLSRPVTIVALIGLLIAPAMDPELPRRPVALAIAVLFAGVAELYFAVRVGFDAALFHHLASAASPGEAVFTATDAALAQLGLLPAAKAGRSVEARAAGAKRLFALQILACGIQVAVGLVGASMALG